MFNREVSIVLSGEAGQGLNTIESLFMSLLQKSGYNAFMSKEFMSRVRGGNNTTEIRVSSEKVFSFADRIDILIVLSSGAISRLEKRLSSETVIIGEMKNVPSECAEICKAVYAVEIEKSISDLGGSIYANNLVNGILSGLFSCDHDAGLSLIRSIFLSKGEDTVSKNITAYQRGIEISKQIPVKIDIKKDPGVQSMKVLSGTESIGIGAIAGGCDFIASYPMSPSTGVLAYMAKQSMKFGIAVEQAEDEIAAINMMLGAWYAGARGMVTTSGGGFALMTEGMSLAGCIESPAVINLAQRPGPATGLPTRTEQGDLNLALYAGHGDFPRIIYAPGSLDDGITLASKAFDVADKFQVPVVLLTDQYFLDSVGMIEKRDFSGIEIKKHTVETGKEYKRYAITPSGISPRGIPGSGSGFVCVDSDEHSEGGRITEDFDVRIAMSDKRMRKLDSYEDIEPEIIGASDYSVLVAGWGSTCGAIREAILKINRSDIAFAYFKQVYPVPKSTKDILSKAKIRILVENNYAGQFGNLLKMETMTDFDHRILKYNGMPFSVEELEKKILEALS
ncbi:MAG: 2-oxoacid:acceptor oxidoreductase subunit alpha [Spirochaetes bacterium]|nr:2-oxoacid:acceptor oxidoreductase subunit alpha [Spirochaetota bacterium]